MKNYLFLFIAIAILSSCSARSLGVMTSKNMNKVQLGMTKEQVTQILGNQYTIAEKSMENGIEIEVISYYNYTVNNNEYYQFLFLDNKLEKWYRELGPGAKSKE